MKLRFDAALPYQRAAIDSVLGLFEGQPLTESAFSVSFKTEDLLQTEYGLGNNLVLDDDTLRKNLHAVQERNGLPKAVGFGSRDYSIEMETGTGKTYVYLRTAFELNKVYGFRKFVIVVPSVPIREGVLHSIATMKEHFAALYGTPFSHFVYDSKQPGKMRNFATANAMQIMVINIQAFQRDVKDEEKPGAANLMYVEQDKLSGHRPIDFLRATNPVVIVDEPQKMEGEASSAAIRRLNPLCTLRYSATYDSPNKIYRLGPIEALDQRLVKRIEVASVVEDQNVNDAFVRLLKVDAKKMTAQVEINVGSGAEAKQKKVTVKRKDDLFVKSGERQEYRSGYIVETISFERGNEFLAFGNGGEVRLGQALGGLDDEVMKAQIRTTIEEHLKKERVLRAKGIKVLSLFFIDRVANYRVYNDDGSWTLGKIGQWFEETIHDLMKKPQFKGLLDDPIGKIHNGYFSADKKGAFRDTTGATKDDDATYELIMREKERLLSFEEPLRFIFSHSALREGWDNPNVFQICTLNETKSVTRKRQEIGRGLRLPVNQDGERIHDEQVNRLTVVANESYKSFAQQLQTEYEQDCGIEFGKIPRELFTRLEIEKDGKPTPIGQDESHRIWDHLRKSGYIDGAGTIQDKYDPKNPAFVLSVPKEYEEHRPHLIDAMNRFVFANRVVNTRNRQEVKLRKQVLLDPEFEALWQKVSQRTRYRVRFATDELIRIAADRIHRAPSISPLSITVRITDVELKDAGIASEASARYETGIDVKGPRHLPDVLAYLQNETELTRHTLARILIESGRAEDLRVNPQAFVTLATNAITGALHELMLNGIEYERIDGKFWEMRRLEEEAEQQLVRYLDNLYRVQNSGKVPFDFIEYDSNVERAFAEELDKNDAVKFFLKLPKWFKVDTPLGTYNPDWAILLEEDTMKLYLVNETKGTTDEEDLRNKEAKKLKCGRAHFKAIGVPYLGPVQTLSQMLKQARKAGDVTHSTESRRAK